MSVSLCPCVSVSMCPCVSVSLCLCVSMLMSQSRPITLNTVTLPLGFCSSMSVWRIHIQMHIRACLSIAAAKIWDSWIAGSRRGVFLFGFWRRLVRRKRKHGALQRTATHCNALQRTAMHCNPLQRTATHCNSLDSLKRALTHYYTLQCSPTPHCNTMQYTTIRHNTLQLTK